jgi:hypothetical protein
MMLRYAWVLLRQAWLMLRQQHQLPAQHSHLGLSLPARPPRHPLQQPVPLG